MATGMEHSPACCCIVVYGACLFLAGSLLHVLVLVGSSSAPFDSVGCLARFARNGLLIVDTPCLLFLPSSSYCVAGLPRHHDAACKVAMASSSCNHDGVAVHHFCVVFADSRRKCTFSV